MKKKNQLDGWNNIIPDIIKEEDRRYKARGTNVDYVIFGHIHSARVGDTFSRSSSMVGANDYSEKALNLAGRASQNCYIFYENGNRDGIKIDLQNYGHIF